MKNLSAPVFSVIIPVFNKWELTENCLRSLAEHTADHDYEVIVIDNASSDATATQLPVLGKALFGRRFTAIRHEENHNYGPACNAGAQQAAGSLLFFLNNDTLLTPGWAAPLLEALAADSSLGAGGPLLLFPDNTVQHLGLACGPIDGLTHLYSGFPADHPLVGKKRRLQALSAAALLIPRDLFLACGSFYAGYRNGFEDVELCLRIRAQGKKLACVPDSRIYHLESQTPGRSDHEQENARLFASRYGDALDFDLHQHGQRDGFSVVLDDALRICLLVNESEDQALRQRLHRAKSATGSRSENETPAPQSQITNRTGNITPDHPLQILLDLLRQNPYWLWGQETLAASLEQAGDYAQAFVYRKKILRLCFTRQALAQTASCVEQSAQAPQSPQSRQSSQSTGGELWHEGASFLATAQNIIPELAIAAQKLEYLLRRAEERRDNLLAALCRDKLTKFWKR